jgi:tetrahydromethanopterin S-methyltransferase subunit F
MGSREYTVQSPISPPANDVEQEDTAATQFSTRLQDTAMEDIRDKAENITRKRNLEGNNTSTDTNSFASLSNSEIVVHASMMGVKIPDNNFSSIDLLRELECARENIDNKHMHSVTDVPLFIKNNVGETTPLSMGWADENEGNDEDFILVES